MLKSRTQVTDEPADESVVDTEEDVPERGKVRLRPLPVALLVVALVAAGFAVFFSLRLQQADRLNSARQAALDAGRRYALDLTSYDYRNLSGNFRTVAANSTPSFASQYQQVSQNLTKLLVQDKATAKGNVVSEGVVSADENQARLILFVDQTITNTNSPQPRVDRNRLALTLVNSGGDWRINTVALQ